MIDVVAVGYTTGAVLAGRPVVDAYADGLARDDLASLAERAAAARTREGTIVVVYPRWHAEPTERRIETVRSALATDLLVGYASPLPPLAGGVLAALAAALAEHAATHGELAGALPVLERQLVRLTWLSRLSALRQPNPTVWQHAVSLLPGTRFAVSSYPMPAVRRIRRDDPAVTLPPVRRSASMGVAVSSREGDLSWLREHVTPALGEPPIVELPPCSLVDDYWGTGRVLESVVYPSDVDALARAVLAPLPRRTCEWCGGLIVGDPCPVCRLESRARLRTNLPPSGEDMPDAVWTTDAAEECHDESAPERT